MTFSCDDGKKLALSLCKQGAGTASQPNDSNSSKSAFSFLPSMSSMSETLTPRCIALSDRSFMYPR